MPGASQFRYGAAFYVMRYTPPIAFYLPRSLWLFDEEPRQVTPDFVNRVSESFFNGPWWSWTLQTYLRLRLAGYPCRLVDSIPDRGVVVVGRANLDFWSRPNGEQLFVCMLADGGAHPFAQVQISQNPVEAGRVPGGVFMPHWPQPGLVPRARERGATLRNVGYFGHPDQLAEEVRSEAWTRFLDERGLRWMPAHRDSERNRDYSEIDLIVAVRSFDGRSYDNKPATKLHNAWRAGVPVILGPESAYRAESRDQFDYIEVSTFEETCRAVKRLQDDESLRRHMTERARERGRELTFDVFTTRWTKLIEQELVPRYDRWRKASAFVKRLYFASRYASLRVRGLRSRFA